MRKRTEEIRLENELWHLAAAGFRDITVHTDPQRHWLCASATK